MTSTPYSQFSLSELSSLPIDPCHAELITHHYNRLLQNIHSAPEHALGRYTNKQAAREQLARMTLTLRDYIAHFARCRESGKLELYDEPIESMITDVVETGLTTTGRSARWSEAVFVNSQLWGREQEIMAIMQEQSAESIDDVTELWNAPLVYTSDKVLPDHEHAKSIDLGKDIDWNRHLLRYRSESNLTIFRKDTEVENFEIEDSEVWAESLLCRNLEELDLSWPPIFRDPESNTGRQRGRINTGMASRISSGSVSRRGGVSEWEYAPPAARALRRKLLELGRRSRDQSVASRGRSVGRFGSDVTAGPSRGLSTRASRERLLAEAECSEAENVSPAGSDTSSEGGSSRYVSARESMESLLG